MTALFWEPLHYYHLACEECGTTGLCSTCSELWEAEIDLEVMEAAAKHPKAQFRLTLNSTYDRSGSKRTALFFSRMMKAVEDMRKNSNKAVNTGWEIYKKHS
jgi:hypothetical protein